MKKHLFALWTLIFLFAFTSVAFAADYIVTGDFVNLRSAPVKEKNVITQLNYGAPLKIIDDLGDWILVETENDIGYIYSDYVGLTYNDTAYVVLMRTTDGVNFRKGPSTDTHSYGVIRAGNYVKVLDYEGDWALAEYNQNIGYIHSDYLETSDIGADNLLGIYTTFYSTSSSQSGRVFNIAKSAELINYYYVGKGKTFSMLSAIGPITRKNGYKEAPEFKRTKNGMETVMGYGGGVCQVSTTLYQAVKSAKFAGSKLSISEHHHHGKPVSYIEKGEDATISYNSGLDFKFVNNNDYPIRIKTYIYEGDITCMIYKAD